MLSFASPEFWIALSQIVLINIVLSGDNAVVIALACRSLPPHQQKKAIVFGSVGAIVLRVVLTFFAVMLLDLPYLKLIGAAALLWIGVGLLKSDDGEENLEGHSNLAAAIKTIVVADLVMGRHPAIDAFDLAVARYAPRVRRPSMGVPLGHAT